eukprot:CAMPEP_0185591764 /NCGR_PEP_ID=MMETSP0434-20130131/65622_1 /TAXON_ID=626734 ORGANISM="Favella taraikaensis, Strain Fe Narragansett Bay" /NCGR_SAMPLE_ID=MMETSP0434 /ASSEMBLY_ACC=CAM_ASM_000379 /LENGTH=43 /DNA_ID= /DNA_START= /DNA_END= /DNA_ORIENTATION=
MQFGKDLYTVSAGKPIIVSRIENLLDDEDPAKVTQIAFIDKER